MMFLHCEVISDDKFTRTLLLKSDVESATATIDKTNWNVKINGFKDSLKYIFPKGWVESFIVNNTKKFPDELTYAYGRG